MQHVKYLETTLGLFLRELRVLKKSYETHGGIKNIFLKAIIITGQY